MPDLEVTKMFSFLEENLRFREAMLAGNRLALLFDVAADRGMETALEKYGADLSPVDRAALASLTPAELKTMTVIREKIGRIEVAASNNGVIF
jgi:hypothetical protein